MKTEYINESGYLGDPFGPFAHFDAFPGPFRSFLDAYNWNRVTLLDYETTSSDYGNHCFLLDTPVGFAILGWENEDISNGPSIEIETGEVCHWVHIWEETNSPHRDLPPAERNYRKLRDQGLDHDDAIEVTAFDFQAEMTEELCRENENLDSLIHDQLCTAARAAWDYSPEVTA